MQVKLEFELDQPVDRPLIQSSSRNANGEIIFGTNSELLGTRLPRLAAGNYVYRISKHGDPVGRENCVRLVYEHDDSMHKLRSPYSCAVCLASHLALDLLLWAFAKSAGGSIRRRTAAIRGTTRRRGLAPFLDSPSARTTRRKRSNSSSCFSDKSIRSLLSAYLRHSQG
jgi:hypothetical protein